MKSVGILIFFFLSFLKAHATLSPQAQSYLNKIPEKKITLPFVIKTALENAEAYKILAYQKQTADLEELGKVESLTDTLFTASGSYTDDNSAKTSGFQPLRGKQWLYNLGLKKYWSTGTNTFLGWDYDTNLYQYPNNPGFSNIFVTEYKQSAAVIKIEQNLLKNSFGRSFRSRRHAARMRGEGIDWKTREDLEDLTLKFILQFYEAWISQQQVTSTQDQVQRQQGLVKILTKRSQKGVVESPDLIQIDAVLSSNKARLDIMRTQLIKQWETLVIALKLPKEFLNIDPMDVPLVIDNPVPLGLRICGQKEPNKTAKIATLEKNLEALESDFRAAKSDSLPDLKLIAGYRGNSIDNSAATTIRNVLKGNDDSGFGRGPSWNVGMNLVWPLDNSLARAERTQKYIEKEQTAAKLRAAEDELNIEWRDICRQLRTEDQNDKTFKEVVKQQKKRVRAEEKRFSLGRATVNQLVIAEDDLGTWEFSSQQKEIQVKQISWQIQKYSGELYRSIDSAIETVFQGQQ
jgi:outer membrane protein TolC